jgi:hypothetical protein
MSVSDACKLVHRMHEGARAACITIDTDSAFGALHEERYSAEWGWERAISGRRVSLRRCGLSTSMPYADHNFGVTFLTATFTMTPKLDHVRTDSGNPGTTSAST